MMNSDYTTAVKCILKEINTPKYRKYKEMLSEIGIDFTKLFNVLLDYKWEYNSVTHDSQKKEEEFIRLIKEFEDEETGEKFKLLFDKTPLLKKFCFVKRNNITREQVQNAILSI